LCDSLDEQQELAPLGRRCPRFTCCRGALSASPAPETTPTGVDMGAPVDEHRPV